MQGHRASALPLTHPTTTFVLIIRPCGLPRASLHFVVGAAAPNFALPDVRLTLRCTPHGLYLSGISSRCAPHGPIWLQAHTKGTPGGQPVWVSAAPYFPRRYLCSEHSCALRCKRWRRDATDPCATFPRSRVEEWRRFRYSEPYLRRTFGLLKLEGRPHRLLWAKA